MGSQRRRAGRGWLGVPVVLAVVLAGTTSAASESDRLAAARAAVQKAAAEEKAVHDEWNAKEMARSATREICVVARQTAEKAGQNRAAAEEQVRQKRSAGEGKL